MTINTHTITGKPGSRCDQTVRRRTRVRRAQHTRVPLALRRRAAGCPAVARLAELLSKLAPDCGTYLSCTGQQHSHGSSHPKSTCRNPQRLRCQTPVAAGHVWKEGGCAAELRGKSRRQVDGGAVGDAAGGDCTVIDHAANFKKYCQCIEMR